MPFHQPDSIRYLTFTSLEQAGVPHAVFTRLEGVSPAPWSTLNLGGTVGDDPTRVVENRRRAFNALGRATESLYDVWQVHSADVVCTERPRPLDTPHLKADAILTDRPQVTLFMRFADCVPIFLYDPRRKVAGLVHAGWQGTVLKTAAAAVQRMQAYYGCSPQDVLAAIGPSIGPHHYEVGPDVVSQIQVAFGQDAQALLISANGMSHEPEQSRVQFDLWSANRLILEQSGVTQIEVAQICTACHLEDWYSHRGEHGKTGRFGALIALPGEA